jgi:hypothetical protein
VIGQRSFTERNAFGGLYRTRGGHLAFAFASVMFVGYFIGYTGGGRCTKGRGRPRST